MSTLTKILIVVLTLSSIFLCGIVVTYTATADNFEEKFENQRRLARTAKEKQGQAEDTLRKERDAFKIVEDGLNAQVASMKTQLTKVTSDLKAARRENASLTQQITNLGSQVEAAALTATKQTQLFEKTAAELTKTKAELTKAGNELEDLSKALIERIAVVKDLETQRRRLIEEKSDLQAELNKVLRPAGREPAPRKPVTPVVDVARPVRVATAPIGLQGKITGLDLKNKYVAISIGAAHGVKENMTFYVTRADKFVCEILVIEVDTEKSVGVLKRMVIPPTVGDNISTNM